jgi:RecA-family ATPase
VLAGKPKQGKSFLSMEWALDVVNGTSVFGCYPVEQGEVVYFNLDDPSEGRLQARQRELLQGRTRRGLMWVVAGAEHPVPTLAEGLLDSLALTMEDYPNLRLVIIDTWGRVSKSKGRGEDWYSQDVHEISRVQRWAHQNHVAVLAIHHLRKNASDEELDSLLGSIGVSGTFDNILVLKRPEKSKNATLYGRGRDYKEDLELKLCQENNGAWALQQSKPLLTPEKQAIVDHVRDKGPVSARAIADALGKSLDIYCSPCVKRL